MQRCIQSFKRKENAGKSSVGVAALRIKCSLISPPEADHSKFNLIFFFYPACMGLVFEGK
jgi:hypothetical protein